MQVLAPQVPPQNIFVYSIHMRGENNLEIFDLSR